MDNMHGTPAGGYDGYPAGSPDPSGRFASPPARKKRLVRWGVGVTLAGFLAGGGIALAAMSARPAASPAGPASNGSSPSLVSSEQGAELNAVLNTAASGSSAATPARIRWALGRLRALGGIEGTVTFHNKTGFHTLAFERGTIQSLSSSDVVIKSPDGTTWTWLIVSDTVVRKNGAKTTAGALSSGETVFAGGPVVNGARDARLIVIRAAAPAGSESAQTSSS